MKRTRKDLEHQVEALNKLLGGEEYFLEVMNYVAYGPNRYRLSNKHGIGRPLCTWDRMPMIEMYRYLHGAITAIGIYANNLK